MKAVFYPEDQSLARNEEVSLVGNRAITVFDPIYVPIAGVPSDEGKFTGATGAFSEVMKKITDPTAEGFIGINPAFLPSIEKKLKEIQDEGFAIDDSKNFGKYISEVDHHMLLSSAIANRMVGELKKHQLIPQSIEEKLTELRKEKESESFVAKLGLEKPDEKPRSFVEAAQAGKYGKMKSSDGAHEL